MPSAATSWRLEVVLYVFEVLKDALYAALIQEAVEFVGGAEGLLYMRRY